MRTPTSSGTEHGEPTREGEVNPDADITPPTPARSRIAAGTTPPRRRHTADEVIESGEIVERRSLVIRSKTATSFDLDDEVTEVTLIRTPAPQTRGGRRMLWLLVGIACGAIAVALALLARPRAAALEARAEMIGTVLDGESRAARVRVEAIASSPVLRAGIETDGRTLADMVHDNDLVLPLQRGDVIDVFQIRDGIRTLVLRLPAGATVLAPPTDGTVIEAKNHGVVVVAKAAIPKQRSGIAGEIVLSTPVDLTTVSTLIAEHASGAVLEGLGEPIVLVQGGTPNVRIPITTKSPPAGSLSLAAVVRPTVNRNYALGFMAASILALSIFAASVVRERRQVA